MARPKDDGSPTAETRLENAFFEVLATTPFDKITVSAIVKVANVNRNSFYYHFADLDDLASSAVANLLMPQIPQLLAKGFAPESNEIDEIFSQAIATTESLQRVPVLMGAHSTTKLRNMLKAALWELWLEVFELTADQLDHATASSMDFALGGMLELLSKLSPQADIVAELTRLRALPIVQMNSHAVMATLRETAQKSVEK